MSSGWNERDAAAAALARAEAADKANKICADMYRASVAYGEAADARAEAAEKDSARFQSAFFQADVGRLAAAARADDAEARAEAAKKEAEAWRGRAESKWLQTDKYAARVCELEAALRPFAELVNVVTDVPGLVDLGEFAADCRRARSLLEQDQGGTP